MALGQVATLEESAIPGKGPQDCLSSGRNWEEWQGQEGAWDTDYTHGAPGQGCCPAAPSHLVSSM